MNLDFQIWKGEMMRQALNKCNESNAAQSPMQQLLKFNYKSLNMPFRRPDLERDMMRQSIKQIAMNQNSAQSPMQQTIQV
jgi:hypothetical protein